MQYESDDEIRADIQLSAEGSSYALDNRYLSGAQKDTVEGWFQLPVQVQTAAALGLAHLGIVWWEALLWAWIPSTVFALLVRGSSSITLGNAGHKFRMVVQLFVVIGGVWAGTQGNWSLVVLSLASFVGLVGMLSPAMAIMSASKSSLSPKYAYASRAFGIVFPFQQASERLATQSTKPKGS